MQRLDVSQQHSGAGLKPLEGMTIYMYQMTCKENIKESRSQISSFRSQIPGGIQEEDFC